VSYPKITGKSRKKAEDQPLVSRQFPGVQRLALNCMELTSITSNLLHFCCATVAQNSRNFRVCGHSLKLC
jgi:hypothetical protein